MGPAGSSSYLSHSNILTLHNSYYFSNINSQFISAVSKIILQFRDDGLVKLPIVGCCRRYDVLARLNFSGLRDANNYNFFRCIFHVGFLTKGCVDVSKITFKLFVEYSLCSHG